MTTILFSSAGRRTELLNCFREDAAALQMPLRVLAVDVQPQFSAACQAADAAYQVPRCTEAAFIPTLLEICQREKVTLLVPTIDTELETLATAQEQFNAMGTRVHVSDAATVHIARNKTVTAEFLTRHGIPTPRTGSVADVLAQPDSWSWPIILKPIGGSSSVGIQIVRTLAEFEFAARQRNDYLAQELWKGHEYTINVFFDQAGKLRCAVPHLRKETRTGEVSKGITTRLPLLMRYAEQLGAALTGARGALCFQAIVAESGEGVVFEINARFGGGYPLAHRAGGMFSKWLLEEIGGLPSTANNDWQDRLMMLRYDAAVFAPAPVDA